MTRLIFIDNALEPDKQTVVECDDVCGPMMQRWVKLPQNVALFHNEIALDTNVTPQSEDDIAKLRALTGTVYCVQYPGLPVAAYYVLAAVVFAVVVYSLIPGMPQETIPTARAGGSANNDLSERSNKPRINGRIPDIYGEVLSVPDLIAATYTVFRDNEAFEYAYMCIGRGAYDVQAIRDDTTLISSIDGASVEVYGPNTSPNTPLVVPQITVGDPIGERVLTTTKAAGVNGQTLPAPNEDTKTQQLLVLYPNKIIAPSGSGIDFTSIYAIGQELSVYGRVERTYPYANGTYFVLSSPDQLDVSQDGTISGLTFFIVDPSEGGGGDDLSNATNTILRITMATQTIGGNSVNLTGDYMVSSDSTTGTMTLRDVDSFNLSWLLLPVGVTTITGITVTPNDPFYIDLNEPYIIDDLTDDTITLLDAGLQNNGWATLYNGGSTMPNYPNPGSTATLTLALNGAPPGWIGPFDIFLPKLDGFILNFVANNGMYRDDGTTQTATNVTIAIEYTPLTPEGSTIGLTQTAEVTMHGSALTTDQRGITFRPETPIVGADGVRVRVRRLTERDLAFVGQLVDAVQWKDLYGTATVEAEDFGDVTTVQSLTQATKGALAVAQRRLNMRVTRKVPILTASAPGVYTLGALTATKDAASIIAAVCLDPYIGNRVAAEIDFYNLRSTVDAVTSYFGKPHCGQFSYTFDDDNTSFEEIITTIADAVFCTALRRGNVIGLHFEKATEESSLIFCHRNKVPRSETRTNTFGGDRDNDGVEYQWIDPTDGATRTLYYPEDRSAVNPKKITSVGVRSYYQAYFHGWRLYQRMIYQRVSVEFKATYEAEVLSRNERVLVSDNTRPRAQDGEVKEKNGLVLTLSQPVYFESGLEYSIALQMKDATVQMIVCTPGVNEYEVVLAEEPAQELSLNPSNFAIATYILVPENPKTPVAFLIAERVPDGPFTSKVVAINYDARYYAHDQDFNARIAIPMEDDATDDYDDATDPEKAAGAYVAEDDDLIPTLNDDGYLYAEDDEDD